MKLVLGLIRSITASRQPSRTTRHPCAGESTTGVVILDRGAAATGVFEMEQRTIAEPLVKDLNEL
jgi:hypothetical protein